VSGLTEKNHSGGRTASIHHNKESTMITIENATVETLDQTQARPNGKTVLSVTIGDHTFDMMVDETELIDALASHTRS